jgi:uncharacterized membrane protein YdjX (TVP38/TMEM64 family)
MPHANEGARYTPPPTSPQGATIVRRAAILLTALFLLGLAILLPRWVPVDQAVAAVRQWIAGLGIWGPVGLALLYILATILLVPGTILSLVAGAMFGLPVGMVTVSIGSTLGAALAFLIARHGAREKVARLARRNRYFGAIDKAIGEGGWKIVALLRLSPAIPFNLQNYVYGLTPIRFLPYLVTSWLAMLPGTFLFVYMGYATGAVIGQDRPRTGAEWFLIIFGLLATAIVSVYIARLARDKLRQEIVTASAAGDRCQGGPSIEQSAAPPSD